MRSRYHLMTKVRLTDNTHLHFLDSPVAGFNLVRFFFTLLRRLSKNEPQFPRSLFSRILTSILNHDLLINISWVNASRLNLDTQAPWTVYTSIFYNDLLVLYLDINSSIVYIRCLLPRPYLARLCIHVRVFYFFK